MNTWITCGSLCAFFILGMWVAHRMDLDKKVKKWADRLPVPDLDGSLTLTDAKRVPGEYGEEAPALPPAFLPAEDRRPTIDRLKRVPLTDWERASNQEFIDAYFAEKRRARK